MRDDFNDRADTLWRRYVLTVVLVACWVVAIRLLTGCWHTVYRDTECVWPTTFHSGAMDCKNLQTVAGKVPPEFDEKECIDGDPNSYWTCKTHLLITYANSMRAWISTAIAVCKP